MGPSSEPTVDAGSSLDEPSSEGCDCLPGASIATTAPCAAARSEAAMLLPGAPVTVHDRYKRQRRLHKHVQQKQSRWGFITASCVIKHALTSCALAPVAGLSGGPRPANESPRYSAEP